MFLVLSSFLGAKWALIAYGVPHCGYRVIRRVQRWSVFGLYDFGEVCLRTRRLN